MEPYPFHISLIEISSMFGTKNIHWETRPDVNILGGINGSGKSTIIKSCYELLHYGAIKDEKLAKLIGNIKIKLNNGYTICWDKIETGHFDNSTIEEGYEYIHFPNHLNDNNKRIQRLKIKDANGQNILFRDFSKEMKVLLINSFEQRVMSQDNKKMDCDDRTYLDILIHEEIFQRNSLFAGAFETLLTALNNGKPQDLVEAIKSKEVQNFMLLYPVLKVFMKEYEVSVDNQIKFKRNRGEEISYTDLSMGEKQLVLLLLMINNTAKEPCIFFMDEPDLGMHIEWKEILIKTIREMNPNMQIILSTHAPSMIEGWYDNVKEVNQITI